MPVFRKNQDYLLSEIAFFLNSSPLQESHLGKFFTKVGKLLYAASSHIGGDSMSLRNYLKLKSSNYGAENEWTGIY